MTPYENIGSSDSRNYNYQHSRTRIVVERSFGILKGRFRCLKHLRVRDLSDAAKIIEFCVCIHNFIMEIEDFEEGSDFMEDDFLLASTLCPVSKESLEAGKSKRDAIRKYLKTLL
jgi:hypothetical protein